MSKRVAVLVVIMFSCLVFSNGFLVSSNISLSWKLDECEKSLTKKIENLPKLDEFHMTTWNNVQALVSGVDSKLGELSKNLYGGSIETQKRLGLLTEEVGRLRVSMDILCYRVDRLDDKKMQFLSSIHYPKSLGLKKSKGGPNPGEGNEK